LEHGALVRIEPTPCVLALDGERDIVVRNGMLVDVQFDVYGPRVVHVQRALELGVAHGLFDPDRTDMAALTVSQACNCEAKWTLKEYDAHMATNCSQRVSAPSLVSEHVGRAMPGLVSVVISPGRRCGRCDHHHHR
jgi:hypothetical protein